MKEINKEELKKINGGFNWGIAAAVVAGVTFIIGIFDGYIGMDKLMGLQVTGRAEIVNRDTYEYEEVMKLKGVQLKALANLPINLNIVKVSADKYEFLNSDFKKIGLDSKQILINI